VKSNVDGQPRSIEGQAAKATRVLTRVERKFIKELRWLLDERLSDSGWSALTSFSDEVRQNDRPHFRLRVLAARIAGQLRQPEARVSKSLAPFIEDLVGRGILIRWNSRNTDAFAVDGELLDQHFPVNAAPNA